MLKKGNTDINKGYLGSLERKKAYLGSDIVFDSSVEIDYYLNFGGNVNQDYLAIPQSEAVYAVPSSGDFEYGIKFKVPTTNNSSLKGLIGHLTKDNNNLNRYGFTILGDFLLCYCCFPNFSDFRIENFITNYGGQIIDLSMKFTGNDVVIFIDGLEVQRATPPSRPLAPVGNFYVVAFGDTNPLNPAPGRYFDGEVYSFFVNSDLYLLKEGNGFTTDSESGITATGQTSNAGGLTYWNGNVWEEL